MKFLLLFVVSFFCVSSFATIRTVSNNPSTIAQFSNIQTAIDASADGDTVYVHGSPIVYADFNIIDKKIAVIGPGRAPDTELQYSATCNFITLDNTNNPGSANGSEVNGLQINFSIVIYAVDNIRIIRCSLGGEFGITANRTISSLLLESCIIKGMTFNSLATYTNMLVQNCIIYNYIPVSLINISGLTNSVNVRFNHNLFYGSGPVATGGHDMFSNNCRNIIFTNNIFTRCNPGPNLSFSSFSKVVMALRYAERT